MATTTAGKTVKVTHKQIMANNAMKRAMVKAQHERVIYGVVNEQGYQFIDPEKTKPVAESGNNPTDPRTEANLRTGDPGALSIGEIFHFAQGSKRWLLEGSSLTIWGGFYSADFK